MPVKKVKDEDGNEYEIELPEEDDEDDDEDEDDENIYLTEKDLRWLKEARKAASNSSNGTKPKSEKKKSGIAVRKNQSPPPKDTGSQKKSRIRKLTIS